MSTNERQPKTTAYVIFNSRGHELMVCATKETAEFVTDRTVACYWRQVPLVADNNEALRKLKELQSRAPIVLR